MDIPSATGGLAHMGKNPVGQDSLLGIRAVAPPAVLQNSPEVGLPHPGKGGVSHGGAAMATHQWVRWHPQGMPLKVAVAPWPPELWPWAEALGLASFDRFAWAALQPWVQGSEGRVAFEVRHHAPESAHGGLADGEKSQTVSHIDVVWTDTAVLGRPYEVGHTDRRIQPDPSGVWGGLITSATITLLICPAIDKELTPEQRLTRLKATLLHEMGHALGLDHGQSPLDVMYYRGWENTQLSPQDLGQLGVRYPRDGRRELKI